MKKAPVGGFLKRTWSLVAATGLVVMLGSCSSSADTSYLQEADDVDGYQDQSVDEESEGNEENRATDYVAEVREGTFQIELDLPGDVARGQFVPLVSGSTWTFESQLGVGETVSEGEDVGDRRIEPSLRAALEESATLADSDRTRLDGLTGLEGPVTSPISGTIDPTAGVVYAPGLELITPMNPTQELRFLDLELTGAATVETIMGIRTYQCDALWIDSNDRSTTESVALPQLSVTEGDEGTAGETDAERPDPTGSMGGNSLDSGTGQRYLHCRLPAHAETVPGINGSVTVTSEPLEDVTLVPVYYLQYEEDSETYFVTTVEDGVEVDHEVTLGPTDGVVRVVTSELPIGATLVEK